MNDTRGVEGKGWYGFDLDGTLAKYDGWKGIDHIGEPVKPMVELIKRMHDEGKVVKIVTSRVSPRKNPEWRFNPYRRRPEYASGDGPVDAERGVLWAFYNRKEWGATEFVADWCQHYLGFIPEIVYRKDLLMLELYDDRAKQVVPNEGWLVEDIAMSKRQRTETTVVKRQFIDLRWWERINCFLLGMMVGIVVYTITLTVLCRNRMPEAEKSLYKAAVEYRSAYESNAVKGAVLSLVK